ncbi:MAG: hypothetical protein WKI04_16635 [Ferruginibacter sp.]
MTVRSVSGINWRSAGIVHLTAVKPVFIMTLQRMKEPEKASPDLHKQKPPGAPFGCE